MCVCHDFSDPAPVLVRARGLAKRPACSFAQRSATCANARCQALIDRCPVTSGTKRAVCHNTRPSLSQNDDDVVILGMRHVCAWVDAGGPGDAGAST